MWRSRVPTSPLEHEHSIAEMHKHQPPRHVWLAVCLRDGDRLIAVRRHQGGVAGRARRVAGSAGRRPAAAMIAGVSGGQAAGGPG
jgi:hypothetical protein